MGMIINIDEALKQRTAYNVLKEPLHMMLQRQQEEWEKQNPIDLLFKRGTLSGFQETYTSSIGFEHAFKETSDYAVGEIFNTAEGFAATYTSRTFQGSFIITQQVLEDGKAGQVKDDATQFLKRWHGDTVEYAMTAIDSGFGVERVFEGSRLRLTSADTTDGDVNLNGTNSKNPLFTKSHKTVKRSADATPITQSNMYYAGLGSTGNHEAAITINGEDATRVSKLADFINMVITDMENYKDDNGKRAGVSGQKIIVAPNDARLKAALEAAVSMEMFGPEPNVAFKRAIVKTTPYLNDINACSNAKGFFIVDPEYNAGNHGPEFTERVPLTLEATWTKRPMGVIYDGRQRFDINVASWRGIVYCALVASTTSTDWNYYDKFTEITPVSIVKPVAVVNTVSTKSVS